MVHKYALKEMMKKIFQYIVNNQKKLKKFVFIFIAVVFLYSWFGPEEAELEEPIHLQQVELVAANEVISDHTLTTTLGTVQSLQDVDIHAQISERVVKVHVKKGQKIEAGQVLLELEHSILDAQVLQAEAKLSSTQATLAKMQNGERPEDVEILKQKLLAEKERLSEMERGARQEEVTLLELQLENAKKVLQEAERDLLTAEESTENDEESQIQKTLDLLQTASVTMNKVLSQNLQNIIYPIRFPSNKTCELEIYTFASQQIKTECFEIVIAAEKLQESISQLIDVPDPTEDQLLEELQITKGTIQDLQRFMRNLLEVVNGAIAIDKGKNTTSITPEELTNLKTPLTGAQNEVENLLQKLSTQSDQLKNQDVLMKTELDTAQSKVTQAENNVLVLEKELELKRLGATDQQIAIQESQIKQLELQLKVAQEGARPEDLQTQYAVIQQAQADVAVARANRDKAIISSPIAGTVLTFPFRLGDSISVGDQLATVANQEALEVLTFITEDEHRYISPGTPVSLLDGGVKGLVSQISPALEQDTKKIEVTVEVTEGIEKLVIGQTVFVGFLAELPPDSVRVPLGAVHIVGNEAFVFSVNEENIVVSKKITPGKIFGESILISDISPQALIIPNIDGLKRGEVVIPIRPVKESDEQYMPAGRVFPELSPQISPA